MCLSQITIYDEQNKAVVTVGQSNVCLQYIGSLCSLYPETPLMAAFVDEILASVEDTRSAMSGKTSTDEDRGINYAYYLSAKNSFTDFRFEICCIL